MRGMKARDQTELRLISLLRSNARAPVVELTRKLKVSRATVSVRCLHTDLDTELDALTRRQFAQIGARMAIGGEVDGIGCR